jgi:hypothetical protein
MSFQVELSEASSVKFAKVASRLVGRTNRFVADGNLDSNRPVRGTRTRISGDIGRSEAFACVACKGIVRHPNLA